MSESVSTTAAAAASLTIEQQGGFILLGFFLSVLTLLVVGLLLWRQVSWNGCGGGCGCENWCCCLLAYYVWRRCCRCPTAWRKHLEEKLKEDESAE